MNRLIPLVLAVPMLACAHMQVPPDLKSSEVPVAETPGLFSGNLRFGPFRAMEISKGFTSSSGSSVRWFGIRESETSAHQDYSFRFEEVNQEPREVACRAAFAGTETSARVLGGRVSSSSGQETLECHFGRPGAPDGDGVLHYSSSDSPAGRLELGPANLDFAPDYTFDGGTEATGLLGFVISRGGQPVAAVDRNKTGIWMKPGMQGAELTAAGVAASILFIYRPQNPAAH